MTQLLKPGEISAGHNYTSLFSQAPAPIAIYKGRELRYVFVNDAYSKIFNHREILGKTVREAFPELEGQPYFAILEEVFDTGNTFYGNETPALLDVNNDGVLAVRYYNLIYTSFKNDDGETEGVMAFGHDVTDLVEAREKQKESDSRFRNIVEQSLDPIFILKGEDLVVDVANKAVLALWNSGEESIGKRFLDVLPEMESQGFHMLMLDVLKNGVTHHGHQTPAHFTRATGLVETRYFDFIYQPYREADESISGVLVLASDVTERVIAKQKFEQSVINFGNMILQAPVAMCVLTGPTYVVGIANSKMYELWGKGEKELLGKPIFDGLPEAKGQGLETLLDDVFVNGNPFTANERPVQLPRNGKMETFYLNFVYEPFREGDGSISGIIAVATDVTEQVEARHKIQYVGESARLAIESAELGTYEVNLLTEEITASDRLKTIFGIEKHVKLRNGFSSLIHPHDNGLRLQANKEALTTGNLHYEARIILADETLRWIKVKGKVLYDAQGTPERLLGVVQDITEQKLSDQELTNKVEERTKALKETNELLERSNEELEQFAYIASHDLQEPLRKIQLFNSLLTDQADITEASRTYIKKVSASAARMAGLIRDLLDYSRLSQKSLQFEKTDLNDIKKNVITDFEILISQKKAVVESDDLPTIEAIPLQMNQLLYNLIGNALKFAKRGIAPVITITAKKLDADKHSLYGRVDVNREYCEIQVVDNGIGFNQEYADKIFTIFQKLNEKSLYGGYGIGLALCKKIVDNHSGAIYAKGESQNGALFSFILPYKQY